MLSAFFARSLAKFMLNKIMLEITAKTIKKTVKKMTAGNKIKIRLFAKMAAKLEVRTLVL